MEYDEETLDLFKRTIAALLAEPDTAFLTHDGEETTTHTYAAFLQEIVDKAN